MKKGKLATIGILIGLPFVVVVGLFYLDTMRSFLIAEDQNASTDEPWSIVVVAGQSNAEGTSSFIAQMPEEQQLGRHPADDPEEPNDNALLWWEGADGNGVDNATFWEAVANPTYTPAGWIKSDNIDNPEMEGLINFKDLSRPPSMGQRAGQFGPEIGIARELYDQGRRKIIVLKVTYGFQTLAKSTSQFVPYDWNTDCSGNRSNKSYCHLKSAYQELTNYISNVRNEKYTVDGLFWLQGESDTLDSTYADAYLTNFRNLVSSTRTDLGMHPQAHFVARKFDFRTCLDNAYPADDDYCGFGYALRLEGVSASNILDAITVNPLISIPINTRRIQQVRESMQIVANENPLVDVVETDFDQPFAGDYIHLNATGQLAVGKRMAKMFNLPYRPKITDSLALRNDYDGDGLLNSQEDTGSRPCNSPSGDGGAKANNGNLGDDDCDGDGFPNYLDKTSTKGSGLQL